MEYAYMKIKVRNSFELANNLTITEVMNQYLALPILSI